MRTNGKAALQRSFDEKLLACVSQHPLFRAMRDGIDEGEILPALRQQEVHFYEAGARLLCFRPKSVLTHEAYLDDKNPAEVDHDRAIKVREYRAIKVCEYSPEKAPEIMAQIRRTASSHRKSKKADGELVAVHQLFPEFAITRSSHHVGKLALIDVETRFESGEGFPGGMIDLVFLLPDCRLLFIEAKCIDNRAARSTKTAKVVCQILNYEHHITRDGVLAALNRSLCAQSRLIERDLGQAKCIAPRVPLLILAPDGDGLSPRSSDKWLRTALENASKGLLAQGGVAVINGTRDPAKAIREYVNKLTP